MNKTCLIFLPIIKASLWSHGSSLPGFDKKPWCDIFESDVLSSRFVMVDFFPLKLLSKLKACLYLEYFLSFHLLSFNVKICPC